MTKFINENWFKVSILIFAIIAVIVFAKKDHATPQSTNALIPTTQNSKTTETKPSYPVGSYNVFIEQYGKVGSKISPTIKIYNSNTGTELQPEEKYVYYKFFGTKTAEDTISVNCANMSAYSPTNPKSTSGSSLNIWGGSSANPTNDPTLDTSIDMLLLNPQCPQKWINSC